MGTGITPLSSESHLLASPASSVTRLAARVLQCLCSCYLIITYLIAPKATAVVMHAIQICQRNCKGHPLSEKVDVFNLIRKRLHAHIMRLLKSMVRTVSIHETVKKEKEIWASFATVPQAVRVTAMAILKKLVRLEKAQIPWVDMNRTCVQTDRNVLGQKALSIYKTSATDPEMSDTSHLLQVRDGYIDLDLDWKYINYWRGYVCQWRSHCHISGRVKEAEGRLRHITFIMVCCYNRSILLPVVVNLLLCLIY